MSHDAVIFLQGISSMGAYASSLVFFRFWRQSRDSLFVGLLRCSGCRGHCWRSWHRGRNPLRTCTASG
jgi:hypothetical protein